MVRKGFELWSLITSLVNKETGRTLQADHVFIRSNRRSNSERVIEVG